MKFRNIPLACILLVIALSSAVAQVAPVQPGVTPVQAGPSLATLTAVTATAAVNTATTLTIQAPPNGMYVYVCKLAYQVNNDNTATAVTNVVSTNTNFGTFATKFSSPATASIDSGIITLLDGSPATGCARAVAPSMSVTFVSPAGLTHSAWTWYATFFYGF